MGYPAERREAILKKMLPPNMGIPAIPTTDSGLNRPPIPEDSVQSFRRKPSTRSGGNRPPWWLARPGC